FISCARKVKVNCLQNKFNKVKLSCVAKTMGRLSAYAKNRILKLRFKKNKRIIHIVEILKRDDNIKVSRQAVSTFLKKYLETNSIYDKPRTGRKRKLTHEEIQLIGQVTRLNRDITARAIKEYLNLNVSTYTILRATKLFEWNKSNEAKLDENGSPRQKGSPNRVPRKYTKRKSTQVAESDELNQSNDLNDLSLLNDEDEIEKIQIKPLTNQEMNKKMAAAAAAASGLNLNEDSQDSKFHTITKTRHNANSIPDFEKVDLNLIEHRELLILKNLSCSPMSFATKILFKIFKIEELHGHNVSGKTLNKNLKAKLPLDPIRIGYIKFLVEKYYDEKECREMLHGATSTKQDLWKSCHTAINKSILISERKAAVAVQLAEKKKSEEIEKKEAKENKSEEKKRKRTYASSSEGDDFDDMLESEEYESGDNANDEEDDDDEIEMFKNKKVNRKKNRPKAKKSNSQSDESNESDTDEYANEIELIQNIENRLVNPKEAEELKTPEIEQEKEESSEALAAANIAAAMKKRFVVVAPNSEIKESEVSDQDKREEKKSVRVSKKNKKSEEEIEVKSEKEVPDEPNLVVVSKRNTRNSRARKESDREEEKSEKDSEKKNSDSNDRIQTRRSTRATALNKSTIVQNLPKAKVVRRFTGFGYKKRSVYCWLDVREKDRNGRPAKIATKLMVAKLRAYFNQKSGQHVYLGECIKKRLEPMIKEYNQDGN
ncbi:hypothetical protein BpHYR1_022933, partial [Brachionus plicatilis]